MATNDLRSIQAVQEDLLRQYREQLEAIRDIQVTLRQEVLPGVLDEVKHGKSYGDSDNELEAFSREWIDDTGSIFRTFRRHKYTKTFSVEAMRSTLLWRLRSLSPPAPVQTAPIPPILRVFPSSVLDPLGRPILVIKAADVSNLRAADTEQQDRVLEYTLQLLDALRLHLKNLSQGSEDDEDGASYPPTLQYTLLLDVSDVSIRTIDVDILRWYMNEVQPHFPAIVGTVFVLNYSWAQAGAWNIAKRLLPASTLAKIFFLDNKELVEFFRAECVPWEYGGTMPRILNIPDALGDYFPPPPIQLSPPRVSITLAPEDAPHSPEPIQRVPSAVPTSLLNPFFGYPVSSSLASASYPYVPGLRHGRRRKRDLVRTLAWLWWERWKRTVGGLGGLALLLLLWRWRPRSRRRIA